MDKELNEYPVLNMPSMVPVSASMSVARPSVIAIHTISLTQIQWALGCCGRVLIKPSSSGCSGGMSAATPILADAEINAMPDSMRSLRTPNSRSLLFVSNDAALAN